MLCVGFVAVACQRADVEKDVSSQQVDSCSILTTAAIDEDSCASSAVVVPRKHKKIHRSAAAAAVVGATSHDSTLATETHVPMAPTNPYRKPANPYVAYRNIKLKVNGWNVSVV